MSVAKLTLSFLSTNQGVELERTEFAHPLLDQPCRSVRGKMLGASVATGTFQWTAAVRGFAELTVLSLSAYTESSEAGVPATNSIATLSGLAGSPAAALDYAISRQPNWLVEMFGFDSRGIGLSKRLFRRSNSERKRPGPVSISINPNFLSIVVIQVKLDDQQLILAQDLRELLCRFSSCGSSDIASRNRATKHLLSRNRRLLNNTDISSSATIGEEHCANAQTTVDRLKEAYTAEISSALKHTEVFSANKCRNAARLAAEHPSFVALAGDGVALLSDLDLNLSSSGRLGIVHDLSELKKYLCDGPIIRCAVSPAHAGTMAILTHLKLDQGINLEINFRFAHSVELVNLIISEGLSYFPDLCSLTIATVGTMLSRDTCYKPLMLMPKQSHGVLVTKNYVPNEMASGRFLFMTDTPATESFIYDRMVSEGVLNSKHSPAVHMEPVDVSAELREGESDARAIIGFPHYTLNLLANECSLCTDPYSSKSVLDTVLVAHESFMGDSRRAVLFDIAIRSARIELMENRAKICRVVDYLFAQTDYLDVIKRASGVSVLNSAAFARPTPRHTVNNALGAIFQAN